MTGTDSRWESHVNSRQLEFTTPSSLLLVHPPFPYYLFLNNLRHFLCTPEPESQLPDWYSCLCLYTSLMFKTSSGSSSAKPNPLPLLPPASPLTLHPRSPSRASPSQIPVKLHLTWTCLSPSLLPPSWSEIRSSLPRMVILSSCTHPTSPSRSALPCSQSDLF